MGVDAATGPTRNLKKGNAALASDLKSQITL